MNDSLALLPAIDACLAAQAAARSERQQQQQPQQHSNLRGRARSCSPADTGGLGMEGSLSTARSMGNLSRSGSQRSQPSLSGSQSLRPPRPPPLPLHQLGAAGGAAAATPDSQQAAAGETVPPPARRPAEAEESALLAEGWEAVDAAEASLPARREFSMAHLLAPQVDGVAVAGVTPRATSSSSAASASSSDAPAAFSGRARAKVRPGLLPLGEWWWGRGAEAGCARCPNVCRTWLLPAPPTKLLG